MCAKITNFIYYHRAELCVCVTHYVVQMLSKEMILFIDFRKFTLCHDNGGFIETAVLQ